MPLGQVVPRVLAVERERKSACSMLASRSIRFRMRVQSTCSVPRSIFLAPCALMKSVSMVSGIPATLPPSTVKFTWVDSPWKLRCAHV